MRKNKRDQNPGSYDGKRTGVASTARVITEPLPSQTGWGKGIRRRMFAGDVEAQAQMVAHVKKWAARGMPPERIAKRVGLPWRSVYRMLSTGADLKPRLRKGDVMENQNPNAVLHKPCGSAIQWNPGTYERNGEPWCPSCRRAVGVDELKNANDGRSVCLATSVRA